MVPTGASPSSGYLTWAIRQESFLSKRKSSSWDECSRSRQIGVLNFWVSLFLKREHRINIDGNLGRRLQRHFQSLRHLVIPGEPFFGTGRVARGFDFQKFLGEIGDSSRDDIVIEEAAARRLALDSAAFG